MQTFGAQDRKLTPFKDGSSNIRIHFGQIHHPRIVVANLNAILMRSDMVYIYEVSGNNIVKTLSSAFSVYVLLAWRCEMAISYFYSLFVFLLKLNFRLFVDTKLIRGHFLVDIIFLPFSILSNFCADS